MKKLIFELKDDLFNLAFPEEMLKERRELLLVLVEACKYMMYNDQVANANHKFMLVVGDMNRLFFCTERKMYSFMFPFHIDEYPSVRYDYDNIPIDSKMLSDINQILESDEFLTENALDFITPIEQIQETEHKDFWRVMKHLLTYEIGYVRYDDDLEGFRKASDEGTPRLHPRYHYDVNLDSQATFKLGLSRQLTPDKFIDFLDNKKNRPMAREQ